MQAGHKHKLGSFNPLIIGARPVTRGRGPGPGRTPPGFNPLIIGARPVTVMILCGAVDKLFWFQSPNHRGSPSAFSRSVYADHKKWRFNPLIIGARPVTEAFDK